MRAWSLLSRGALPRQAIPRQRRRGLRRRAGVVDPFAALQVQCALARLQREIRRLEGDEGRFALAHHLYAAIGAYDQLLDEACRLAGICDLPADRQLRRLMSEVELRIHGWQW